MSLKIGNRLTISDRLANRDFFGSFFYKACLWDPCENDNSKLVVVVIDVDVGAE